MKHLQVFEAFSAGDKLKVETKVLRQDASSYWADVIVNGENIGRIRKQYETINLDLNKTGRTRTRVYYSLTWDQTKAKEFFGVPVNNFTRKDENKFNSVNYSAVPGALKIKKYIESELVRLKKIKNNFSIQK